MDDRPITFARLLRALELFGPQARPYNFDDHFDCWGLVRRVFDWLDDGYEVDEQLGDPGSQAVAGWRAFTGPDELVPGDLLTTHAHAADGFHTVFYCGRVGRLDVVYDSSPRGMVPLFARGGDGWRWVADRELFTKYGRAPETTDRLRNDGGAYLRLWDDRMRYYNLAVRERLEAGGAAGERDLVAPRRAAGLSDLPFYCVRRLPRDTAGREIYDNLLTRRLDYYVPDGAPLLDDDYEVAVAGNGPAPDPLRPPAPTLLTAPEWRASSEPLEVTWSYAPGGPTVDGCRVEVWEETRDLWKHRLLREDRRARPCVFRLPPGLVWPGSRFAVIVYARAGARFSAGALAPFVYQPAPDDPLLAYNPYRPTGLRPDADEVVPTGRDITLEWTTPDAETRQAFVSVLLYEGFGCPAAADPPVWRCELSGPAARASRCEVPAAVLRPGAVYYWYVTPRDRDGRAAYAPAEGVFSVAEGG